MAEEIHKFTVSSTWTGNSDGDGVARGDGWSIGYGSPASFGGKTAPQPSIEAEEGTGGRANPEELLISAVVSCYCITLAYLAERKRLPLERIEMDASGEVVRQVGGSLKFESITLRPQLLSHGADESQVRSLTDCAHKAETYCPVSNALRGNVRIEVCPEVTTDK